MESEKFDKKKYLEELYKQQKLFSKKYKIYIDPSFDPRSFLKSFEVEAELYWPKDIKSALDAYFNEQCKTFDFWFIVYSDQKRPYSFVLKYGKVGNGLLLFPKVCAHDCPYKYSQVISFGKVLIYCKHLYAAFRKADEKILSLKNSYKNVPIATSSFIPRNKEIFNEFKKIENSKISPYEKLRKNFELLEKYLYVNELPELEKLNFRLKYLKKS